MWLSSDTTRVHVPKERRAPFRGAISSAQNLPELVAEKYKKLPKGKNSRAVIIVAAIGAFMALFTLDWRLSYLAMSPEGMPPILPWLLITLLCSFLFVSIRSYFIDPTFSATALSILLAKKVTPDQLAARIERFNSNIFKAFFFMVSSVIDIMYLKDSEFLPPALFGAGDAELQLIGFPHAVDYTTVLFYGWHCGYHFYSFVHLLGMMERKDFIEMLVHHVATVILLSVSYATGFHRMGAVVLLVHDIPDITIYLTKLSSDLLGNVGAGSSWLMMVSTCGYFRLYAFPKYSISVAYNAVNLMVGDSEAYYDFTRQQVYIVSLSALYVLHWIWMYMFFKMMYDLLFKKKVHDSIECHEKPAQQLQSVPPARNRRSSSGFAPLGQLV